MKKSEYIIFNMGDANKQCEQWKNRKINRWRIIKQKEKKWKRVSMLILMWVMQTNDTNNIKDRKKTEKQQMNNDENK